MSRHELRDAVIDSIYDASVDSALWPQALEQISGVFGGLPAQLLVNDPGAGELLFHASVGLNPRAWDLFRERYATLETNPTLGVAMRSAVHQAVDQGAAVGMSAFLKSDLFADLYRPQNHLPFFGTVCVRSPTAFGGIAVMRDARGAEADADDLRMGERISHHVGRALSMAGVLTETGRPAGSFEAALERSAEAIVLFAADGRIVWCNAAAEAIFAAEGGPRRRGGRLTMALRSDQSAFEALFAEVLGRGEAAMMVRRKEGAAAYILRARRLWRSIAARGACVLATLAQTRARLRFDAEEAARLFGLTAAEARAACELCAGAGGLHAAAQRLKVSPNTFKTLLHRAYAKVGVRSQGELSTLLATTLRAVEP